jgi:hypothetical protein
MHRFVLALWMVLSAVPAMAMDIATYDKQRREPPNAPSQMRLRIYLLGLGEGLRLANTGLAERNEVPLYCQPPQANLFAEDYRQMIDAQLKDSREALQREDLSIERILLRALQDRFPCARPAGRLGGPSAEPSAGMPAAERSAINTEPAASGPARR